MHAHRHDLFPSRPGHLVVLPDGSIEAASLPGRAWARRAGFVDLIAARIRALDAGNGSVPSQRFEDAQLAIVRLEGAGSLRYLVTVTPYVAAPRAASRLLTPRQRAIAELAIAGLTIPGIARHLRRSPETVRSHMRQIYSRLEISSRVELVRALS